MKLSLLSVYPKMEFSAKHYLASCESKGLNFMSK